MKTFIAVMLASSLAFGQDPPADAPVADLDAPGRVLDLDAGSIVPFKAQCLDDQELVRRTRREARAAGTLAAAESKNVLIPKGAFAGIIIGAIVLSAAAAATVTYVALPKR